MAIDAKKSSGWDTLRLQVVVTLPAYLWGSVAPTRLGVALLSWLDAGQALQRFFDGLRKQ